MQARCYGEQQRKLKNSVSFNGLRRLTDQAKRQRLEVSINCHDLRHPVQTPSIDEPKALTNQSWERGNLNYLLQMVESR